MRRDPLARAVQVDGAGIRALKLGERPAGDERVDDGVELGGKGATGTWVSTRLLCVYVPNWSISRLWLRLRHFSGMGA